MNDREDMIMVVAAILAIALLCVLTYGWWAP